MPLLSAKLRNLDGLDGLAGVVARNPTAGYIGWAGCCRVSGRRFGTPAEHPLCLLPGLMGRGKLVHRVNVTRDRNENEVRKIGDEEESRTLSIPEI